MTTGAPMPASVKPLAAAVPKYLSGVPLDPAFQILPIGKGELLREGEDIAVFAIGATVCRSLEAAEELEREGVSCAVVNARFAKPLDSRLILNMAKRVKRLVTVEENTLAGGFGSAVTQLLQSSGLDDVRVKCLGIPDVFVEHGAQQLLRSSYHLDAPGIAHQILASFPELAQLPAREKRSGVTTPSPL